MTRVTKTIEISNELFESLRERLSQPLDAAEALTMLRSMAVEDLIPAPLKVALPVAIGDIEDGRPVVSALASLRREIGLEVGRRHRVDWIGVSGFLSEYARDQLPVQHAEAKYWFEVAEWLALLAVFTYAARLMKHGTIGDYFLDSVVFSMRLAIVYLLTTRLFLELDRPLSFLFSKARGWGFIDYRLTAAIIRVAATATVGVGSYLFISRAVDEVVMTLPRAG